MEGLGCEVEWSSRRGSAVNEEERSDWREREGQGGRASRVVVYRLGRGGDALKSQGGRHGRALEVRSDGQGSEVRDAGAGASASTGRVR